MSSTGTRQFLGERIYGGVYLIKVNCNEENVREETVELIEGKGGFNKKFSVFLPLDVIVVVIT